jgi:hypothetical protein
MLELRECGPAVERRELRQVGVGARRRCSSIAILLAIVYAQARRCSPWRSFGYAGSARRNVSWKASRRGSRPSRRTRKA